MKCETADELAALAKEEGFDITKEEAEAYLEEMKDIELDETMLKKVAGGGCYEKVLFWGWFVRTMIFTDDLRINRECE